MGECIELVSWVM